MTKTLIYSFVVLLSVSTIALAVSLEKEDCSRETVGVLFAGGVNAAKFFEFNEKTHKCELKKEASKLLDQLDVRAGLMQSFSEDVKQFLCEEPNTEGLKELILNKFRTQDLSYYKEHQNALETYTINSFIESGRTKENIACPSGYEIIGNPCHWKCIATQVKFECPPPTMINGKEYKFDYNTTSFLCDGIEVKNKAGNSSVY